MLKDMIWSVVSKAEMEGCGTNQVFKYYREALGNDNIKLAIVDENDTLGFVSKDDIVLLRDTRKPLIDTIRKRSFRTTAEDYNEYKKVADKGNLGTFLSVCGIPIPLQYPFPYKNLKGSVFVKPRYGSDSMGITSECICNTQEQIISHIKKLKKTFGEILVEQYIEGREFTVSCINVKGIIHTAAIEIDCSETGGIQTRDCKVGFKEYCSSIPMPLSKNLETLAIKVFRVVGLKHYARIDFRMDKKGRLYVIDVNPLPGLGPIDHLAKSFLLARNFSYTDTIKMVIASAT